MNECYNIVVVVKVARLTAVAIAIATRPFKFHEISVSNTSSSFVSSIHSFECRTLYPAPPMVTVRERKLCSYIC